MKMKLMTLALLASISAPAFADPILDWDTIESIASDEPISPERKARIIQALESQIRRASFSCNWNRRKGPSNTEIIDQLILVLKDTDTRLSVSSDRSQPVIRTTTKDGNTIEITIHFTTTPDFTRLTRVEASKDILKSVVKNVGTLIDPRFETVSERTSTLSGSCKIK
jgi:hypothetical protein